MTPERFALLRQKLARRQPDLTVLAEDVHKPQNFSAILRSCDAVGIGWVHAVAPDGHLPRFHLTSGGSRKWVKVRVYEQLQQALDSINIVNYQYIAAHISGKALDFREVDYTRPTVLVLGSELRGLSPAATERVDQQVMVPMHGMVSSLNVSVACAVILYEAERQRQAAGYYDKSRLSDELFTTTLFEWAYPSIANRCRARKLPYPPLDDDGLMLENPLSRALSASNDAGAEP